MGWDTLPELPAFEKARRREIYRKLASVVRGAPRPEAELPSLADVRKRLRLFDQRYVGIQPIPVADIVGTVDRRPDFAPGFLPRDFEARDKWRRVEQAFPTSDFPPIVVYQVGEAYFVVDGHHRVGIAKMRDIEFIDAEVTEVALRHPLNAELDVGAVIHAEQRRIFMEASGLGEARPDAEIEFSRPLGYVELLDLVKAFGYELLLETGGRLTSSDIAGRWYDEVFLPALAQIEAEGLREAFPDRTGGDLFLWVHQRRQAFFPEHGHLTVAEAARHIKQEP